MRGWLTGGQRDATCGVAEGHGLDRGRSVVGRRGCPRAAAAATVPVTLKEFAFVPRAVTVGPAAARFVIANAGTMEHDFMIDALRVKSPLVRPGQSVTVLVTLKPGN